MGGACSRPHCVVRGNRREAAYAEADVPAAATTDTLCITTPATTTDASDATADATAATTDAFAATTDASAVTAPADVDATTNNATTTATTTITVGAAHPSRTSCRPSTAPARLASVCVSCVVRVSHC